jgi:hypothetical protein
MTSKRPRLRPRLSYANVIATIALFAALCGGAYAATGINGKSIVNKSIAAKKLKNGTLTSKQVKKNSLNGSVIDASSLGTVPSAQTAATATSADTAASATTAGSANTAKTAGSAATAAHALSAETADKAQVAGSADFATEAELLDGLPAKALKVSCPEETDPYGGMCWDRDVRPADDWIGASIECGDEGGRLPSLSELIGYVFQSGTQVTGQTWTGDVADFTGGKEIVLTSDENTTSTSASTPASLGYRCLFYQVN